LTDEETEKLFAGEKKSDVVTLDSLGKNFFGESAYDKGRAKKRKKLPIAVDILISVLMVAIVVGFIFGAYFLFKLYTNDYNNTTVEYTFITYSEEEPKWYKNLKGDRLYFDVDGSAVYFGRISEVGIVDQYEENGKYVIALLVKADVKYKQNEGYQIGDNKIAVGSEYDLRSGTRCISGTVVEVWKDGSRDDKGGLVLPQTEPTESGEAEEFAEGGQ